MHSKAAIQQAQAAPAAQSENNKDRLNVLMKEYELTLNRIEGFDNRFLQIIAGLLGLFGLVAGYFFINPVKVPIQVAWIAPAFFTTLFMFGIFVVYLNGVSIQNARMLTERINDVLGQTDLITYHANMPGAVYLSPRRGKLKLMYSVLYGGLIFLVLAIEVFSWIVIYGISPLQGSLFIAVYGLLSLILLAIAIGYVSHTSKFYLLFRKQYPDLNKLPNDPPLYASSVLAGQTIRGTLSAMIPRMSDFLTKAIFLIFGFIVALVIVGVGQSQFSLLIINALFSSTSLDQWKHLADIPTWVVWMLGAIYLVVEEVLLQQAKLIWNDIRDVGEDKKFLQNLNRPFVSGSMSLAGALTQLLVRVILAFLLGYILGGLPLVVVFLVIYLHQAVYVLWAKPRAKKHPLLLLFILAFNLPLRFLAGVVAVAGVQWSLAPFLVIFVLFYFYSVGELAFQWKVEVEYYKSDNPQQPLDENHPGPRAQSLFYLEHGWLWQHVGLIAAVLVAGFGWLVQWLAQSCDRTALLMVESLYGSCTNSHSSLIYTNFGWFSLLVIPGLIILFTLITIILVYLPRRLGQVLAHFIQQNNVGKAIKGVAFTLSFCVFLAVFYQAVTAGNMVTLFVSFIPFGIFLVLLYEGMNYLDFTFENPRRRFPLLVAVCFNFFFEAREGYTWSKLQENLQKIGAAQFKPRKPEDCKASEAAQFSPKKRFASSLMEDLEYAKIKDPEDPTKLFTSRLVIK